MRVVGTVARGLRAPIIQPGDDLGKIIVDVLMDAVHAGEFEIRDRDILGMTEAILARAQNNYASADDIAEDIRQKIGGDEVGLVFPITSRNRFSVCLRGIAKAMKKIYLQYSYPSDEVGNPMVDIDTLEKSGVNPYSDVLSEEEFIEAFGAPKHPFTDVNYIECYREVAEEEGCEIEFIFANDPTAILDLTDRVICCDIHSRQRSKRLLKGAGAKAVYGLDDIMTESINGSGYNEQYGLLGSNKATEDKVKLFPVNCYEFVKQIQDDVKEKTGKTIEVLVYGDGAFRDPQGHIWELADPVVSPGYTEGLEGKPKEIKLKYLADNDFAHLSGEELREAIAERIKHKGEDLSDAREALGTTPRRLTDLIGSLCDLVSGSGDKGTPFVYVQGYFDSYTDQ